MPPKVPQILTPLPGSYLNGTTQNITYTDSNSPNGYTVGSYNTSLFNSTLDLVRVLNVSNNPVTVALLMNMTLEDTYYVGVRANDSNGQYSDWDYINIVNYIPPTVSSCVINQTYTKSGSPLLVSFTSTKTAFDLNRSWITSDIVPPSSETLQNISDAVAGAKTLWWNTSGVALGNTTVKCYTNDTQNFAASQTNYTTIYVSPVMGAWTINQSVGQPNQTVTMSVTVTTGNILDTVWVNASTYTAASLPITSAGTYPLTWTPSQAVGVNHTLQACVNNTLGEVSCGALNYYLIYTVPTVTRCEINQTYIPLNNIAQVTTGPQANGMILDKVWYVMDTVPASTPQTYVSSFVSNPQYTSLNTATLSNGNWSIKCYVNNTYGYSNSSSLNYTYVYAKPTISSFTLNQTMGLYNTPVLTTTIVDNGTLLGKVYVQVNGTLIIANQTTAAIAAHVMSWTPGIGHYILNACVNNTIGDVYCTTGVAYTAYDKPYVSSCVVNQTYISQGQNGLINLNVSSGSEPVD
jgi:hypothetical protein